jgi:hypothetical protein
MRSFNPKDEWDRKEAKAMAVEPWMLELLELNPDYISWGPHEDCMTSGSGWSEAIYYETWRDCDLKLDDLNEVVNFYFELRREASNCVGCDKSGYSPEAKKISDDFYDFAEMGRRWCDKITLDEAKALVDHGRLQTEWDERSRSWKKREIVDDAFVREVNAANGYGRRPGSFLGGLTHDAINRHILIETRCKRLGIPLRCAECKGRGELFVEERAHVALVLWLLHPRKGASRGVEIERVRKVDIPATLIFLRDAAARNAKRFEKATKALRLWAGK